MNHEMPITNEATVEEPLTETSSVETEEVEAAAPEPETLVSVEKKGSIWGRISGKIQEMRQKASEFFSGAGEVVKARAERHEAKVTRIDDHTRTQAADRIRDFREKISNGHYGTIADDQVDLLKMELRDTESNMFSNEGLLKSTNTYNSLVEHKKNLALRIHVIEQRMLAAQHEQVDEEVREAA
jgi:hypothetical protein